MERGNRVKKLNSLLMKERGSDPQEADMIYYRSASSRISTTVNDKNYIMQSMRNGALLREHSVIKRTRRHPRATTLPGLTRRLMQFFPGTGILRSTQMIVLHEGRGSEAPKGGEEGWKEFKRERRNPDGTKGVRVVNNSRERDRRSVVR